MTTKISQEGGKSCCHLQASFPAPLKTNSSEQTWAWSGTLESPWDWL